MFDGSIERVKCITELRTNDQQDGPSASWAFAEGQERKRLLIVCKMTGQTRLPLVA